MHEQRGATPSAAGAELGNEVQWLHSELEVPLRDNGIVTMACFRGLQSAERNKLDLLRRTACIGARHGQLAAVCVQVAAAAQRALQERLRDLEVLNEELVIAKNAMLSDLMVRLILRDICSPHAYHAHVTFVPWCAPETRIPAGAHWWRHGS
jgi:hypothetical protein